MKKIIYLLILIISVSCSNEPEPINYGADACDFCEMTIVSSAFSAQAVSTKGKQFKYDAIECMVNDLHQIDVDMAVLRVADYAHPGTMISVKDAVFVVNDSIKSPMGANLAAVKKNERKSLINTESTFDWEGLKVHFLRNDSVYTINR
ncbi:nitrous oxide reductase accessory protein NosL [Salinimicrobium soli]|uniref:nitrous oxide reductase accessory protein NosL n=1 Tax=Salinimicrobium soli TaxID=1254399 RepID=UPI003AAA2C75